MFPYEVQIREFTVFCLILYTVNLDACKQSFKYSNLQGGLNIDRGYDYQKCIGLKVKPRQGDGLLFYSLLPNGKIDKVIFQFQIYLPFLLRCTWIEKFSVKLKGNKMHAKTQKNVTFRTWCKVIIFGTSHFVCHPT